MSRTVGVEVGSVASTSSIVDDFRVDVTAPAQSVHGLVNVKITDSGATTTTLTKQYRYTSAPLADIGTWYTGRESTNGLSWIPLIGSNSGAINIASCFSAGSGFSGVGTAGDAYRFYFDGCDDRVVTTALPVPTGSGSDNSYFTWVNIAGGATGGNMVAHGSKFSLVHAPGGITYEITVSYGNKSKVLDWTSNYGSWHSVAAICSGGVVSFYLDGAVQTGGGATTCVSGSADLWMGANSGYSDYFRGDISQLALFSRGLSAAEVAAIHADGPN